MIRAVRSSWDARFLLQRERDVAIELYRLPAFLWLSHAYLPIVHAKEVFVNAPENTPVPSRPYMLLMHAAPAIARAKSVQMGDISTSLPHPPSQLFRRLRTPLITS